MEPNTSCDLNIIKDIAIPLLTALIGAGIGAYVAFRVSRESLTKAFQDALDLDTRRSRENVRGFLLGVQAEVQALRRAYEREFLEAVMLLEPGKAFEYTYPIYGQYLTVFESGAHMLGQVPDSELRTDIIELYTKIRGLIDTHLYNNELLEKRHQIGQEPGMLQAIENNTKMARYTAAQADLDDYGINIRHAYEAVLSLFDDFNDKVNRVSEELASKIR